MTNFSKEELNKAKMAKSVEELLAIAKENGMELTREQAQEYFAQLNPPSGELADEELDNVSGGACYDEVGNLVASNYYHCELWRCATCGSEATPIAYVTDPNYYCKRGCYSMISCSDCSYGIYKGRYCICTHPSYKRK